MKKILCLLVLFSMALSPSSVSLAVKDEIEPQYGYIKAEFSDANGAIEKLKVMNYDGHIYADANELCVRLGYQVAVQDEYVSVLNTDNRDLPISVTQFYYDSSKVNHWLFSKLVESYEAPFKTMKNEEGIWLPLEYSLLILNSGSIIVDGALRIDMPRKSITDLFSLLRKEQNFAFDWNKDFGYSDLYVNVIGGSSHLINVFNGLLTFDAASWALLFQQFAQDFSAYDSKYGEDMALLICTNASMELEAAVDQVDKLNDVFSPRGSVGKLLAEITVSDKDIGELNSLCEKYLGEIRSGNSTATYMYNRTYQQLEKAIGNDAWYSELADSAMALQSGLSRATTVLEVGSKIAEVAGYMAEFANQDQYSISALRQYLETIGSDSYLPAAASEAMQMSIDSLSSNMAQYSVTRFITENLDDLIEKGASKIIGSQANIALLAWSLASDFIPFVSEGLSSANEFELAVYATVFQADARMNYQTCRDEIFQNADSITAENLTKLASYCYVYLKSCYIARDSAIASLSNLSKDTWEQIQPLIDEQTAINKEIAEYLAVLRTANTDNSYLVFGFLPADNEEYLANYEQDGKDEHLLNIFHDKYAIDYDNLVTDAYNEEFRGGHFAIPQINLDSEAVAAINAEIWETLYVGVVDEMWDWWNDYDDEGYDLISYKWTIKGDILSVLIESRAYREWSDYYVYNISISTGERASNQDILSLAGFSIADYTTRAKQVLGSYYWGNYGQNKENFYQEDFIVGFNKLLRSTISDENINGSYPYFNEQGQLCIIATIYVMAGSGSYWRSLNLEVFDLLPCYADDAVLLTRSINISEDEAYQIACEYWDYAPGDVSPETGFELFVVPEYGDPLRETYDGKSFYCYMLRWLVVNDDGDSWMSTCDIIYIDAETGECGYPGS